MNETFGQIDKREIAMMDRVLKNVEGAAILLVVLLAGHFIVKALVFGFMYAYLWIVEGSAFARNQDPLWRKHIWEFWA